MTNRSRLGRFKPVAVICLLLLTTGCETIKGKVDDLKGSPAASDSTVENQVPVEDLYNKAASTLDKGSYIEAAKQFDDVDREYPYSQWATRAQLMSGYAQYKNLKYDEAVLALDRFIELHPGDESIAYAYYLKALCYYEQISDVRRDQKMTQMALDNLRLLVERFPDSTYTKDATLKIDLTQDHLAGKQMEVGRYYLQRKEYQASIGRFQKVVEQYQTTTHVPEALHRMVEAYVALGIIEEARKTAAILGHNYPNSGWYKDTYRLLGEKPGDNNSSLYDKTVGKIL